MESNAEKAASFKIYKGIVKLNGYLNSCIWILNGLQNSFARG